MPKILQTLHWDDTIVALCDDGNFWISKIGYEWMKIETPKSYNPDEFPSYIPEDKRPNDLEVYQRQSEGPGPGPMRCEPDDCPF